MKITYKEDHATFSGEHFWPQIVFDCGQAFRFEPVAEACFFGVAHGRPLYVKGLEDGFEIFPTSAEDVEEIWRDYFCADESYAEIEKRLSCDEVAKKTLECCKGMRVLAQEPFETVVSFIISANNNVKRIKGIIGKICELAGEAIESDGETVYAFPTPKALASRTVDELRGCGAGYRAEYILETAKAICDGVDLNALYALDYEAAKTELVKLKGVGGKVADCILLFAYHKTEAFPRDVWIKRVLKTLYGFEPKNDAEMLRFAEERFGSYGGIAQQYLFHYARLEKLV